jgi:hypothetical protein
MKVILTFTLRKRYKLISSDFITVNRNGIFVSLKKGATSTLVYKNSKTKETFKVCYNSIKSSKADSRNVGSKTITQKPDNLSAINKIGIDRAYEFVFNAKYKILETFENIKTPKIKTIEKLSEVAFTTNGNMPFEDLARFILEKEGKTTMMELNNYFKEIDKRENTVSKQAFSKQRRNLNPKVFIELNKDYVKRIY